MRIGGSMEDLLVSRPPVVGGRWVGERPASQSMFGGSVAGYRWSTCWWVGRQFSVGRWSTCMWVGGCCSVFVGLPVVVGFVMRPQTRKIKMKKLVEKHLLSLRLICIYVLKSIISKTSNYDFFPEYCCFSMLWSSVYHKLNLSLFHKITLSLYNFITILLHLHNAITRKKIIEPLTLVKYICF